MSRAPLVLVVSLILLALSLRVGLGGLSGLIPTVQDGLRLSGTQVSVLTALPSLCFSLAGLAAGRIILRFGVHQVVVVVSLAGVAGLLLRSVASAATVFLLATALAMIGAAIGNVTLPALTKLHFPSRGNGVTALYAGGLGLSAAVSATAAVPLARATGGWRFALGSWAVVPALAAVLWLPRSLRRPPPAGYVARDARCRPAGRAEPRGGRSYAARLGAGALLRLPGGPSLCSVWLLG